MTKLESSDFIKGQRTVSGPGKIIPRSEALNISRAMEELGYQPNYSLEEGIKLYADWPGKMLKK